MIQFSGWHDLFASTISQFSKVPLFWPSLAFSSFHFHKNVLFISCFLLSKIFFCVFWICANVLTGIIFLNLMSCCTTHFFSTFISICQLLWLGFPSIILVWTIMDSQDNWICVVLCLGWLDRGKGWCTPPWWVTAS